MTKTKSRASAPILAKDQKLLLAIKVEGCALEVMALAIRFHLMLYQSDSVFS